MTDNLENVLAEGIEEDLSYRSIAEKFAPRDVGAPYPNLVGTQKRSMVPAEHLQESLNTLSKALVDLQSLRTRLIGDPDSVLKQDGKSQPPTDKLPVVGQLHAQANSVAQIANEMMALIAQIRERI